MKKTFRFIIILIIFSLLLCSGWVEGQTFPDKPFARLGKGRIREIAYSPDGKLLAVAGSAGIWLYDAKNLTEIALLQGHTDVVSSVSFSPDGKMLASGSRDDTVRLWDVEGKKKIAVLEGHTAPVNSIAFNPDGKTLASAGGLDIRLWDIVGQREIAVLEGHTHFVPSIAFSPNGKMLASGGETVRLWDVEAKKEITVLEGGGSSIAFSPDGKMIASVGGGIRLWDIEGKKEIAVLEGGGYSIAFSPDGKMIASVGRHDIRLWDVETKKEIAVLHTCWAYLVAFSPDGKTLASAGDGGVRLWDVEAKKEIAVLEGHIGNVFSVAFSPDGKTLASAGSGGVRLWDVEAKKEIAVLNTCWAYSVAFSPDGTMLALGGGLEETVRLWDIAGEKEIAVLVGNPGMEWMINPRGDIACDRGSHLTDATGGVKDSTTSQNIIAFSSDGNTLALGGGNNIYLFDVRKKEQIAVLRGSIDRMNSIAFSPDGQMIVASGYVVSPWDEEEADAVSVWDIAEKREIVFLKEHSRFEDEDNLYIIREVFSVTASPDGKMLAVMRCLIIGDEFGRMDAVCLYDIVEKKKIATLKVYQNPMYVKSVAFTSDGKMLALIGTWRDPTIRLWDIAEEKEITILRGHTGKMDSPGSVAFSPDGKMLASGSYDGTILLWGEILPAGVEAKGKKALTWGKAKRTALLQNYPNPFNPDTWIPYYLPQDVDVTIKIYNSAGHLVRTLNFGRKAAGIYLDKDKAAYWDGRSNTGEKISSGVYYYTLQTGEYRATRKMVIIK